MIVPGDEEGIPCTHRLSEFEAKLHGTIAQKWLWEWSPGAILGILQERGDKGMDD